MISQTFHGKKEAAMMAGEKKTIERETEYLDQALLLAREIVVLRGRLAGARREYAELSDQRDQRLAEGIDVLPEIRSLFLEIEAHPAQIASLEGHIHWLVDRV